MDSRISAGQSPARGPLKNGPLAPKPLGRSRRPKALSAREQELLRQVLGARCRRGREELGLSQRALAEAMGRSESWVREIEHGKQYAPAYLIQAMADATGRSHGWFYGQRELDLEALARELIQRAAE